MSRWSELYLLEEIFYPLIVGEHCVLQCVLGEEDKRRCSERSRSQVVDSIVIRFYGWHGWVKVTSRIMSNNQRIITT